jgi:hypothetical protein
MLITLLLAAAVTLAAGCSTTQIQVVAVVVTATPGSADSASQATAQDSTPAALAAPTSTSSVTDVPNPTATTPPIPTETPIPPNAPTPVRARIQVAEQLYEGGRMFWLQPTSQIWVLVVTAEGRGTWSVYQDTFVEGTDIVTDPSLVPPEGRLQPERGFGKLWRESSTVREALDWAVTPEFGYVSDYEYYVSGTDAQGAPVGYHVIYSLYGEQFRFNEIDGTWQLGGA